MAPDACQQFDLDLNLPKTSMPKIRLQSAEETRENERSHDEKFATMKSEGLDEFEG